MKDRTDWQFWLILLWLAVLTAIAYKQGQINNFHDHLQDLQHDIDTNLWKIINKQDETTKELLRLYDNPPKLTEGPTKGVKEPATILPECPPAPCVLQDGTEIAFPTYKRPRMFNAVPAQ